MLLVLLKCCVSESGGNGCPDCCSGKRARSREFVWIVHCCCLAVTKVLVFLSTFQMIQGLQAEATDRPVSCPPKERLLLLELEYLYDGLIQPFEWRLSVTAIPTCFILRISRMTSHCVTPSCHSELQGDESGVCCSC